MIKLKSILSEIKLIPKNTFPKNINWVYKTTPEEAFNIFKKLRELGFKFGSKEEINDGHVRRIIKTNYNPLYIFYSKGDYEDEGISFGSEPEYSWMSNLVKLNF